MPTRSGVRPPRTSSSTRLASELFAAQRALLRTLVDTDVTALARELERVGAPFTP